MWATCCRGLCAIMRFRYSMKESMNSTWCLFLRNGYMPITRDLTTPMKKRDHSTVCRQRSRLVKLDGTTVVPRSHTASARLVNGATKTPLSLDDMIAARLKVPVHLSTDAQSYTHPPLGTFANRGCGRSRRLTVGVQRLDDRKWSAY